MTQNMSDLLQFVMQHQFLPQRWFHLPNDQGMLEMTSAATGLSVLVRCTHIETSTVSVPVTRLSLENTVPPSVPAHLASLYASGGTRSTTAAPLLQAYDFSIMLDDDVDEEAHKTILSAQLQRLGNALRGTSYQLACVSGAFLFIGTGSDTTVMRAPSKLHAPGCKLFLIVQAHALSEGIGSLDDDGTRLLSGMYDTLGNLQSGHARTVESLVTKLQPFVAHVDRVQQRLQQLHQYYARYRALLDQCMQRCTTLEMDLVRAQRGATSNMRQEMRRDHDIKMLQKQLDKRREERAELLRGVIDTRGELEMLTLEVDNVLYNNIAMLQYMVGNFQKLQALADTL